MLTWIKQHLAPPVFPEDDDKTRVARLLNTIYLGLLVIFASNMVAAAILSPSALGWGINIATILVDLIFLYMLRRRYVRLSSWVTVIVFWTFMVSVGYLEAGLSTTVITSLFAIVVLAGIIISSAATVFFTILTLIAGGVLFHLETTGQIVPVSIGSPLLNIAYTGGNLLTTMGLINLTLRNLNTTLKNYRTTNQERQELLSSLEIRIEERTRDLALAAEVGRNLSQVHDQEILLTEAVDLIRERFNLYYVQVYLLDSTQKVLFLRAGTGNVGQDLLRRRHSLPVDTKSINGRAVFEKQSVVVNDTKTSNLFKPNPRLPETRSEMAIPLMVAGQVLGVLDLQSTQPGSLRQESLPVFDVVASQLAISLENARLYAEVSEARTEVETYLRRLTHEGWSGYLNAIDRPDKLVYTFDNETGTAVSAQPLSSIAPEENALQIPITIANEAVGMVRVEADDDQYWTEENLSLVSNIAQQVGQQIENLRLLAEAEQYRTEAETAVRRLSHEAWQDYLAANETGTHGFAYRENKVIPLPGETDEVGAAQREHILQQPLTVQGETIGHLEVAGSGDEETEALIQAVSTQLSNHLESLRLTDQTERALAASQRRSAELSVINEIARQVSAQLEITPLLETILNQLRRLLPLDAFMVAQYDKAQNVSHVLMSYDKNIGIELTLPSIHMEPYHITYQIIQSKQPQLILYTQAEVDELRRNPPPNMLSQAHTVMASLMFAPMLRGEEAAGVLSIQSYEVNAYTESDLNLISSIANYIATGLQNAQLFEEIQRRGEKEQIINTVSQRIQSALTMEEALQTAVVELGRALHARNTQIELALPTEANGNGATQHVDAVA
ncbi:MAG: GAF domain-containing protein [Anaerolineales bacterium]|nr:GAF domain-containing protein [Anaerolineales bacterium]